MNQLIWKVGVIGLGGAVGTIVRVLFLLLLDGMLCPQPYALFFINSLGCFAMGALVGFSCMESVAMQFLSVGILGGFTTFSSFAAAAAMINASSGSFLAFWYLVANPIAGLLFFSLGQYGVRFF